MSGWRSWATAALLLAGSTAGPALAVDESDLLPVDQAFALTATATAADRITLRFAIADGYYLYRHRMAVKPLDAAASIGAVQWPPGKRHTDEFFGEVETWRQQVTGTVPQVQIGGASSIRLQVKYQGCADLGICYPPQTRTVTVNLPQVAASGAPGADGLSGLRQGLRGGSTSSGLPGLSNSAATGLADALPAERAFQVEAIADGADALLLRFTPADGYYLYRDKITLRLKNAPGIRAPRPANAHWPKAEPYHDEHFGDVAVYFKPFDLRVPLQRHSAAAADAALTVSFQGCQTGGICYPPMQRDLRLQLPSGTVQTVAMPGTDPAAPPPDVPAPMPTRTDTPFASAPADADPSPATDLPATPDAAAPSPIDNTLTLTADPDPPVQRGLLLSLLLAVLGGLILNLMPCVLPVLSLKVLSLVQGGESPARTRLHARWYTLGILVSFATLGAVALALRQAGMALGWGFQLQQPLVVALLALIIFALGLSLSGLWYLQVGIGQRGSQLLQRTGPFGDFFTGVLAVVLATPCTAPFMGAALAYAFAGPPWGAIAVFLAMGFGLALPFLLVAYLPALASRLPKPGAWMERLKQLLAFPLYLTAAWLVWVLARQRGADAAGLWLVSATCVALAAWAWSQARPRVLHWSTGVALLALAGSGVLLGMIHRLPRPEPLASAADRQSVPYSAAHLASQRKLGRAVFVNMTADWCVTCKANERAVFDTDAFHDWLRDTDTLYMVGDYTDMDPAITAFLQGHQAVGVPLYVLYPAKDAPQRKLPAVVTPGMVRDALFGTGR